MEEQTKTGFKPTPIKLQGKDYLTVPQRIAWFRDTHGNDGQIDTEAVILGELALIKARIFIAGAPIATGMATIREFKKGGADRSIEKAETAAIGRALGAAGFGTLEAGNEFEEGDYLADSPQPPATDLWPKPERDAFIKYWSDAGLSEQRMCAALSIERFDGLTTKNVGNRAQADATLAQWMKDNLPPRTSNNTRQGLPGNDNTHAVKFNKPDFDYAYLYSVIDPMFNAPTHRDNALKKRIEEKVIKTSMTEDQVIAAITAHYDTSQEAV